MKLIIDIPEEDYIRLRDEGMFGNVTTFKRAVREGIPLEQKLRPMEKFESAKDHISKLAGDYKCWDNRLTWDEALELYHILEQEPCTDAISRQAVLEVLRTMYDTHIIETEDGDEYIDYNDTVYEMEQLLPVIPQPKIAHVISDEDGNIKCSNCGSHDCWGNYCSECGAKMREVEENGIN